MRRGRQRQPTGRDLEFCWCVRMVDTISDEDDRECAGKPRTVRVVGTIDRPTRTRNDLDTSKKRNANRVPLVRGQVAAWQALAELYSKAGRYDYAIFCYEELTLFLPAPASKESGCRLVSRLECTIESSNDARSRSAAFQKRDSIVSKSKTKETRDSRFEFQERNAHVDTVSLLWGRPGCEQFFCRLGELHRSPSQDNYFCASSLHRARSFLSLVARASRASLSLSLVAPLPARRIGGERTRRHYTTARSPVRSPLEESPLALSRAPRLHTREAFISSSSSSSLSSVLKHIATTTRSLSVSLRPFSKTPAFRPWARTPTRPRWRRTRRRGSTSPSRSSSSLRRTCARPRACCSRAPRCRPSTRAPPPPGSNHSYRFRILVGVLRVGETVSGFGRSRVFWKATGHVRVF